MKKQFLKTFDSLNYIFYKSYLKKNNIDESKLLILATIPRSGTHLIKFLFSNYIKLLACNTNAEPVSPDEMNNFFPNNYQFSYFNLKARPFKSMYVNNIDKPTSYLKEIFLNDFTRSHAIFQEIYWKNSPVLHTYRNPLDYAVSMYHYMFKNRNTKSNISCPMDVFDKYFDYYTEMYLSYLNASKSSKYKLLRMPYEHLMRDPEVSFSIILHWLGIEPIEKYVAEACERSSIKKVVKLEALSDSKINPNASIKKGSFVKSGNTGQWKNFFSNSDLEIIEARLNKKNISLTDFDIG